MTNVPTPLRRASAPRSRPAQCSTLRLHTSTQSCRLARKQSWAHARWLPSCADGRRAARIQVRSGDTEAAANLKAEVGRSTGYAASLPVISSFTVCWRDSSSRTLAARSRQRRPGGPARIENGGSGRWLLPGHRPGGRHVHTHLIPKNVTKFSLFFTKFFSALAPTNSVS